MGFRSISKFPFFPASPPTSWAFIELGCALARLRFAELRLRAGALALRGPPLTESALFRERIRPRLELHNFLQRAFAAFLVPGRVHRVAGPEAAAFPAG